MIAPELSVTVASGVYFTVLEPSEKFPVLVNRGPDVPVKVIVEVDPSAVKVPALSIVILPAEISYDVAIGIVSITEIPDVVPVRVIDLSLATVMPPARLVKRVLGDEAVGFEVKSPFIVIDPPMVYDLCVVRTGLNIRLL